MPYVPTNPGGGSGFDDYETDREWYWKLIFYTILFTAIMAGATAYGGSWRAATILLLAGALVVLFLRRCIRKEDRKEAQLEDASPLAEKRS
jgi:Flp pilus assembly protein TadB